ncbi:hypothetical protein G5V59_06720 [Nocardioides sp. W3-2-3]|nr:hypothetical protein [Nocardioides convexus]
MTVGSYRRLLTLPAGLARLTVAGARVIEGEPAGALRRARARRHREGGAMSDEHEPREPEVGSVGEEAMKALRRPGRPRQAAGR